MGYDRISREIETAVLSDVFPGAVLLCARGDQIIFHQAFGLADQFAKRPMTTTSIFDLASLTKPLATTVAVAKLIEHKKLYLDQTIGTILSSFHKTDKAGITIDMLLRHTSGLPSYKEYFRKLVKIDTDRKGALRQMLVSETLVNPPGTIQAYSDLGFMILSWVIETISKQSLDQFVSEQIYSPLGINHLFFIPEKSKHSIMNQYGALIAATQQCPWRKKMLWGEVDDDNAWSIGGVEGHAGLFGDASSIYRLCVEFLNALTGRPTRFLPAPIIQQLVVKKQGQDMVAGFDTPSKINSSAGDLFSRFSVGHLGFTGTSFWIDPESLLIVVFLTNRVHPSRSNEKLKQFRPRLHNLIVEQL
ncbi:MAG: serine hydrolase domain-containing protein [Pseudomonadota bacterium]